LGIDSQVKILPQVHYSQLQRGSKAITAKSCVYGDGSTSLTTGGVVSHTLALTHAHAYTQAGVYSVTLSVSDGVVTDTLTRTNYLTVSAGIGYTTTTRVITYTYDPLYRLTGADYSTGEAFAYAYDAVGNRQALTRTLGVSQTVHNYQYDTANRLVNVDAVGDGCRSTAPCSHPGRFDTACKSWYAGTDISRKPLDANLRD
jgi:YD repeat-containing protein